MTAPIQAISSAIQLFSVEPLYPSSSANAVSGVAAPSEVVLPTPSSITELGASNPLDLLTYNITNNLQSFVPSFFVSGLTAGQQQQLALSLGLSANATSTGLINAINALLTPTTPTGELINVLVGDATNQTSSSASASTSTTSTETNTVTTPEALPSLTVSTTPSLMTTASPVATTISPVVPSVPESEDLSSSTYALPFDTAESVLQSLLIDESSHLLSVANQGMAAYATPGMVSALQNGVDQPHQSDLIVKWDEEFYTTDPVTRVASTHESLK